MCNQKISEQTLTEIDKQNGSRTNNLAIIYKTTSSSNDSIIIIKTKKKNRLIN
uniref:Uncharacterized protein n=1 Tax=Rhizophora mucronata TaxID=61149 RepID=A0A2P2QDT6_RHIMU